jgi:hypothetical protein
MRRRSLVRDRSRAYELAIEAHQYLYPLVLMDVTRRQATGVQTADEVVGRAPPNTFAHLRCFPPVDYHDVPRPNLDVLYSFAWLDVTAGPVILSIPDAGDRYYTLPMYDMWSDVFASPGTRTSGNGPAEYALVETGWRGDLPDHARRIEAPTPYVWIIARMQCDGEDDYGYVNRFQDGMKITVVPDGRPPRRARVETEVDDATPAFALVDAMEPLAFLTYATELLQLHPPHPTDHAVLQRMERLGIVVGERLDPAKMPRAALESLRSAFAESKLNLFRRSKELGWTRNGWLMNTETMGAWGSDYLKRATVDRIGLSAASPEDIIYPTAFVDDHGRPLHGSARYAMRFERHELPPTQAFWSLTVYDDDGYVPPNEFGKYLLRDRDPLEFAADGSLQVVIQRRPPEGLPRANWLPCPYETFNLCLRLYWPAPEALDRTWAPPPVRCLDPTQWAPAARTKADVAALEH